MITLASITLTLTIGLISIAYGQITADEFRDKNELKKIEGYCFEQAVRSANGEAVVNDLVKAGLVDSQYYNMTCSNIEQLLQTCTEAFTQRFGREPYYAYEFRICPKIEQNNNSEK
jgi:hypothetical protein